MSPAGCGSMSEMAPAAEAIVVAATTAEVLATVPEAERLLTDGKRARAAAFRFDKDRDDFLAAHTLARGCAASMLHAQLHELTWQQRCTECGGPHGRPTIAEAPRLGSVSPMRADTWRLRRHPASSAWTSRTGAARPPRP